MMTRKKWLLVLMSVVMAFGFLVGCSGGGGEPVLDEPASGTPADTEAPADIEAPAPDAGADTTAPDAGADTSAPAQ